MRDCHSGPRGTVASASASLARYQEFYYDLDRLEVPLGTVWEPERGGIVAENFNRILRDPTRCVGDWVWILGDDHRFLPDTLMRLLGHGVDAVVPIACRSMPMFLPVLYKDFNPITGVSIPYAWGELNELHGLVPVANAGSAGLLVSRRALDAVGDPWFSYGITNTGHSGTNEIGEDLWFGWKLKQAGIALYADLDTPIGHISQTTTWPTRDAAGRWRVDGWMRSHRMTFLDPYVPEPLAIA